VTLLDRWSSRCRRDRLTDEHHVEARLGAAHRLHRSSLAAVNAATGPTESVPRIVEVMLGPPLVLLVGVLPGQSTVDGRPVAHRLAGPLDAVSLRVNTAGADVRAAACLQIRLRDAERT